RIAPPGTPCSKDWEWGDPMTLTRRELLVACAGTVAGLPSVAMGLAPDEWESLGVVIHSFPQRIAADRARGAKDRIDDPLNFIEHVHALGGHGVQIGLGDIDQDEALRISKKLSDYGMYLEAIVRLPRNLLDLPRFRSEIWMAFLAGASVARAVLLSGRRYETFDSAAAFRRFADGAFESLALAKRVIDDGDVRLAVENHKDFRTDELISILKRVGSEMIGVCLDTGNSIALLEDPMEVVEALAPWAFTTHFKDMAVEEDDQGFLLAEVPFGEGFLDLPRIVRTLRAARP